MSDRAMGAFRGVGPGDAVPNDLVVPYYLDDRKLRISIARVAHRMAEVSPRRPDCLPEGKLEGLELRRVLPVRAVDDAVFVDLQPAAAANLILNSTGTTPCLASHTIQFERRSL